MEKATKEDIKKLDNDFTHGSWMTCRKKDKFCPICGSYTITFVINNMYFDTKTGQRIKKLRTYCSNQGCVNSTSFRETLGDY